MSQKKSTCCPLSVVFPVEVVKNLDTYCAKLGARRGSRVSRSTAIREIVHAALDSPGKRSGSTVGDSDAA